MTEWDATNYARCSALQEAMAAQVLALLEFTGRERVLDIGCGDGRITAEIATRLPHGSILLPWMLPRHHPIRLRSCRAPQSEI